MALNTVFEKEVCGRCSGSGRYSFNLMHGSTCFGCAGKGERLTKRGAVARSFYVESCTITLAEIQIGDVVAIGGVTNGGTPYTQKRRIDEIVTKLDANGHIQVWNVTQGRRYGICGVPSSRVRKYWSKEENEVKIQAALAYQETLTKSGKPCKK